MTNIIIILGAPNDDNGNISVIAKDRLLCAYNFILANPTFKVVCTGGFGEHFNRTSKPHSYYAKKFLIEKGIQETTFLESPITSNTIEDFTEIKTLIQRENPAIIGIITSDFHMERGRILYQKIVNYDNVIFIPAVSSLTDKELEPLIAHEKQAIERLKTITNSNNQ